MSWLAIIVLSFTSGKKIKNKGLGDGKGTEKHSTYFSRYSYILKQRHRNIVRTKLHIRKTSAVHSWWDNIRENIICDRYVKGKEK